VGADQPLFSGCTGIPEVGNDEPHDPDQGAGLLKAAILLETGVKIANRRVEGVGVQDIRLELVWGDLRKAHLLGIVHGDAVSVGHRLDVGDGGRFLKDPGSQDMVDLIGVDLDRIDPDDVPVDLLLQIVQGLQGLGDGCTPTRIGRAGKVGDDHAGTGQFVAVDGNEQIGQGDFRQPVQIRVAHGHGPGCFEIRRQFIKENEHRFPLEKFYPLVGIRRFQGAVKLVKDGFLIELLGDLSPDPEGRAGLATAEGDDCYRAHIARLEEIGHDLLAVFWILRQKPQGNQVMRLSAAH